MKLLRNISLPLIASLALFACERDYDAPLLTEPEYTGPAANITISELRTQNAAATTDVPIIIAQSPILKATITSSDEAGNIYKNIYIQDETGAIGVRVDQNNICTKYPVGQTIYIDLEGLCVSVYGGEQQIAIYDESNNYKTAPIPWEIFQEKAIRDGWGAPENVKPIVLDDISTINTNPDNYKFKLVQFTGVTFQNGGKGIFAPEDAYGEENITDSHGNSIIVRTSNYASFASNKLPEGKGNITGILGRFNGTWQLTLRTANDVSDFTGSNEEGGNEGGETPSGETKTLLDEKFDKENGIGNFTIEDITLPNGSTYVWTASNYKDTYYMMASAFVNGANQNSESRLISPELDLNGQQNITLTFMHTFKTFGADTHLQDLKLEVKVKGENKWTEITIPQYSTGTDNSFVPSGDINLNNFENQIIQFAFHYKSTTENALRWQINNVKVTATTGGSTDGDGGTTIEPTPNN